MSGITKYRLVAAQYPGRKKRVSLYTQILDEFLAGEKDAVKIADADVNATTLVAGLQRARSKEERFKDNIKIHRSKDDVYLERIVMTSKVLKIQK